MHVFTYCACLRQYPSLPCLRQTYAYCVQSVGNPNAFVTVLSRNEMGVPMLAGASYSSNVACINRTIQWAGTVEITILTTLGTPVPGIDVRPHPYIHIGGYVPALFTSHTFTYITRCSAI